jgi:hypothetical protein
MAFTYQVKDQYFEGQTKVVSGTWDGTSVTTGELDMSSYVEGKIIFVELTADSYATTPAVHATIPAVNETLPLSSVTAITIVFASGSKGLFKVYAKGDKGKAND